MAQKQWRNTSEIDDADLRDDLKLVHQEVESPPTKVDYQREGEYSVYSVKKKLGNGSWVDALRAVGIEPTQKQIGSSRSVDEIEEDELLQDIDRVCTLVGGPITFQQYNQHGRFSDSTITKKFGSIARAIELAGWEPDTFQRSRSANTTLQNLSPDDIPALTDSGEQATGGGA